MKQEPYMSIEDLKASEEELVGFDYFMGDLADK